MATKEASIDTDKQNSEYELDRLAKMTASERMKCFFSLFETARSFSIAGLRFRYPNCNEEEMTKRKAALFLGREYSLKSYGWDPDIMGY